MTQPWAALWAFVAAVICVALCWAGAAFLNKGGGTMSEMLAGWGAIIVIVAAMAVIPAAVARLWAARRGGGSLKTAALAGASIGAGLFVVVFGGWMSGNVWSGMALMLLYGGALGLVGGSVFWLVEERILKAPNEASKI